MFGGGYEEVYSNPVINAVVIPLQHSITVGSLLVNGVILSLIFRKHGKEVGTYRYLLCCFAINDISYTMLHYATFPVPETFPNIFIIRGHGPTFSTFWLSMYMGNYATGFPLLVSHFLYRAMALKWPYIIDHFFKLLPIALSVTFLCGATWFTSTYVFMRQDPESTAVMQPIFSGEVYSPVIHSSQRGPYYVVCVYWTEGTFKGGRMKNFIALLLLFVVMFTAYVIIIICCVFIVRFMRKNTRSLGTMRLQRQLFKCLVYQTVIPLITAYFPVGICIFAPIVGFAWPPLAFIIPNICGIHPLFDGLVVMFTVTEYRRSVLNFVPCLRRRQVKQSSNLPEKTSGAFSQMQTTITLHTKRQIGMLGGYDKVYTNAYVNFYSINVQHFLTGSSLVINCLLIYFIASGTGKNLGNYRMLITCFAVNDLIYTTIHFFTYPIPETYTDTFMMRSHGPVNSHFFQCIYIANYGTSFPLLSAHFVYRALTLKWPRFSHHFRKFLALTIGMTFLMAGLWFFVGFVSFSADEESRVITRPLMSGAEWSPIVHSNETEGLYVVGTYWANGTFSGARWKCFGGAAILVAIMVSVYGTIITCSYTIVSFLKTNATSVSSIRLQKQLFRCLIYQTIFPMLTAYFPAAYCIFAPILGFSWPPISIIMPNFCVMHPVFDGAVVLLTVTEYRKSLVRLLFCGRRDATKVSTTPTASLSNGLRTTRQVAATRMNRI